MFFRNIFSTTTIYCYKKQTFGFEDKEAILFLFGRRYKKKKLKKEIKAIWKEISRSKRYGFHFGVMVIQVDNSIPRGISRTLPGRTLSCHTLESHLRYCDKIMIGNFFRTYYIILPQTPKLGLTAIARRLNKISREKNWGTLAIGSATYPDDSDDPRELLELALENACP